MKNEKVSIQENGTYVRGIPISSTAKVIHMKDGSGSRVIISHEVATQPGVAIWDTFVDPRERTDVRIKDDEVIEFPKLKLFEPITIRVASLEASKGRITIKRGEVLN